MTEQNRPPLVLLHGALGATDQLAPLAEALTGRFSPMVLEFEGHGATPAPDRPFRIPHFADNVLAALDAQGLASADLFGYSLGGYVALYLARHAPGRVGRVMTLGTKLRWSVAEASREVQQLDPDLIRERVPRFAERLAARHGADNWAGLLARTAAMMTDLGIHPALGDADYGAIAAPVRLTVGDRDTMAGIEDTLGVFRLLPSAELAVLPATPHPFERVALPGLAAAVESFFGIEP